MQTDKEMLEFLEKMAGRKCLPEGELHLCWRVEGVIAKSDVWWIYCTQLNQIVCDDSDEPLNTDTETLRCMIHATWQQRVTALEKVKGLI